MANEYGEIEQLVNDVTSLDTARMTLRWALERLNTIEKEKADLKKNLTIAEDTSKKLQLKDASLTEAYSSRAKSIEEKEDFYTKLEATMSLLGEGKLDIQQLLKKEAKLDGLRKSLEAEYSDKFEELDRNQRSVIERWNSRLLEVESQYAGRLAEAQQKYDGLRAELESGYQGRLTSLQTSFKSREQELTAKINQLDGTASAREEKLEARRAELEKEHLLKQRETEENYRKLKNMMEAGYEDKLRSMDSDHGAQIRSLEASWQTERNRIVDEQRVREEQFATAQAHIQEIENKLAAQQEKHHNELVKIITEKENAFRAQLAGLEKEKSLKEETVKQLVSRLEKQAADWEAERTRLENEFGRRLAGMDAAMRARAGELEQDYASKKEELANTLAASREEFDREFKTRLAMERQAMEEERVRLSDEKRLREEALALNARKVAELEQALAANHEAHHKELMDGIRSSEASFREKIAAFEAEKQAYNATINNLTVELRQREAGVLEEKRKIAAEFEAKSVIHNELLALTEASYEEKRCSYEEKINALAARLDEAAKATAIEKEKFQSEIARVSAETNAIAEERAAGIRAEYEARKAELEKEFAARYSDRLKALEGEKARMTEALAEREGQLTSSYSKAAELDNAIAELRRASTDEKAALSREYAAEMARALKNAEESAKAREAELMTDVNVLREELTEKDRVLSAEREKLVDELSKASVEAHNRTEERASAIRAEYEQRLAAHATISENSLAAIKNLLAQKEAQLEKAGEARLEAEHNLKAAFEAEKMKWLGEKERLAADFEVKVAEFDATLGERVANIRADYEARKADLEKEFAGRYGDRLKALEGEKARMTEALAEREGQLTSSYAKAAELDNAIAELRRASTDEKAALSREYSSDMARALKNAEESAKAREAELVTDVNVLREELTEKNRVLSAEREKLVDELSKASVEAHNRTEERASAIRAEYEQRLAAHATISENSLAAIKNLLAQKEAQLEKAGEARLEAEHNLKAAFEAEKMKWLGEKERLAADFEVKVAEFDATLGERVANIRADYEARKADLEKEFSARYGDRLKALEAEKARMTEALAEREGQLTVSYAKASELDNAIAELRRASSEDKAALSREYSADMAQALKNAEESAKARETELVTDINVLRGEIEEKERGLSLQREQHAAELSKAAAEAHDRSEERAASIRNDYERRLANGEAAAEARIQELRATLAEKEALLEKAQENGRESEKAIKAAFDLEKIKWLEEKESISSAFSRRAAELEAGLNGRAAAMEAEHSARRGRMEAELASRTEAVHAEVSAKIEFERGNWRSERSRFENLLAETAGNFKAAQKEIEAISAKLRAAGEESSAREARFSKELMEAKANYDRELSYRVTDAVSVQTANLMEALESAKASQKELSAALEEKENSIGALRSEAVETRRDYEERLRSAGSEAVAARRQELEKEAAALREELQNVYQAKERDLDRQIELKTGRIEAENKSLTAGMEQLRAQAAAASAKATEVFNKLMAASKQHQEELFRMKEEHAAEIEVKISSAVEAATKGLANKLALTEAGLEKERENHKKEAEAREKFFEENKAKMAAELESARNYAEALDFKIQDMEKELAKARQTYAAEFLGRINEQDAQIAALEGNYKARQEKLESEARRKIDELVSSNEAKIKDMEEVVKAKEKLIQESGDFWGRKQAEVDKAHSDFNLRVNKFNEELFAQKQALGEKENELNDYRLKLEKEYALRNAETENMKAELTRAIIDYKKRK